MRRVVAFDVDSEFRQQLSGVVRASGASLMGVFPHSGYTEAVLGELRPEVAFVDFALADGDTGTETALCLAQSGCHVIMCSRDDRVELKLCEISHTFIRKPIKSDGLMEVLRPHLL